MDSEVFTLRRPCPVCLPRSSRLRPIGSGERQFFAGTRVPVQTLIDYLEAGHPLEHSLNQFPTVSRNHSVAILELAKHALIAPGA